MCGKCPGVVGPEQAVLVFLQYDGWGSGSVRSNFALVAKCAA